MTIQCENVKKLPDSFKKTADGGNNRLLSLQEALKPELKQDLRDIYESLDLYKAYGKTLDLYGEMVGQKRNGLNDGQYLIMILTKIASNMATTDYNGLIKNVVYTFGCGAEEVRFEQGGEPRRIRMVRFPLRAIIEKGFDMNQAMGIIGRLTPVCVRLEAGLFQGTFEFGEKEELFIPDNARGWGDAEQSVGGYLGGLSSGTGEKPMPI